MYQRQTSGSHVCLDRTQAWTIEKSCPTFPHEFRFGPSIHQRLKCRLALHLTCPTPAGGWHRDPEDDCCGAQGPGGGGQRQVRTLPEKSLPKPNLARLSALLGFVSPLQIRSDCLVPEFTRVVKGAVLSIPTSLPSSCKKPAVEVMNDSEATEPTAAPHSGQLNAQGGALLITAPIAVTLPGVYVSRALPRCPSPT